MKIVVNEKINIFEPTQQIKDWCRDNLVIDNPEYYRLERMGKWTGNTPQTIKLYEYHNTYIDQILLLPFGCIADIWKMHPNVDDWTIGIKPIEKIGYNSKINLYDYQEQAVQAVLKKKNGILVMPCGAGKTQTGIEIISRIGGKALWLTHTQDLLNQSKKRAESVLEIDGTFGTITAGKADVGTHITFATVQTLSKLDLSEYCNQFDVVVVDECFPAGTKIMTKNGEKELQNLIKGDIIVSYNREKRILEYKAVKHLFKIPAHNIVKVKLSNGKEIVTTSNHPFFTKNEQWVNAEKLRSDDYVMQLLWTDNQLGETVKNKLLQKPKKRIRLLLQRMCSKGGTQKYDMDRRTQKNIFGDDEENKREVQGKVFGKNEKKQPYVEERNKGKSFKKVKGNRSSPQIRCGNGCGLTVPQQELMIALAKNVEVYAEYPIPTKMSRESGYPTCYKVDIALPNEMIAIEVDGGSHCAVERKMQDEKKDNFLNGLGWKVLRFKNKQVTEDLMGCVKMFMSII